jgi:hypothetical protein
MFHVLELLLLLLTPFLIVVTFTIWVLWNFSRELRQGRRRRVRGSALYGHPVKIYAPERQVIRFRRSRNDEAA